MASRVRGRLATSSHPRSAPQARWELTPEAIRSLAKQALGTMVTVGYDREEVVGAVASVEVVDRRGRREVIVEATLAEPHPPQLRYLLLNGPDWEFGPGFVAEEREGGLVSKLRLFEVSIIRAVDDG